MILTVEVFLSTSIFLFYLLFVHLQILFILFFILFYICAFYLSIDCVAYLYIHPHLENILTFLFSKRF